MARTITGVSDSRSSKRLLMLAFVLAILSAGLVYVTISRNSKTDEGTSSGASTGGGGSVPVLVAKSAIPARSVITEDEVEVKHFPASLAPSGALSDSKTIVGKAALGSISQGSPLLDSNVVSLTPGEQPESLSARIPENMRAMSISVDQVITAGGLILPGDYVDIIGSFGVKQNDREYPDWFSRTVLENVQVLAVDQTIGDVPVSDTAATATQTPEAGGKTSKDTEKEKPKATTVTLLVTPEQAGWLFLAERNGTLRAIVRSFGDQNVKTPDVVPPSTESGVGKPGYGYELEFIPPGMPMPSDVSIPK